LLVQRGEAAPLNHDNRQTTKAMPSQAQVILLLFAPLRERIYRWSALALTTDLSINKTD